MKTYSLHQRQGATLTLERIVRALRDLEELFYRLVIVPLIAFFPAPAAYGLACLRADCWYLLDKSEREQIIRNLEGVLGDRLGPTERAHVARDYFRRRSCEAMDLMRLAGRGRALARLVEIRGLEHIEAALAVGKGAVICSAHFGLYNGSFSLIGALGFPVTVVGDWRSTYDNSMSTIQRRFWRLFQEKRVGRHRRPNIEPAKERFGTAIRMVEILRSNELITLAVETPLPAEDRKRAVTVDFLGHQILALPGSVNVAQLTGSQLLVMVVRRQKNWRHQILEISPPIPLDSDVVTTFKHCVAMLEAPIHQNLAHWDYWANTKDLVGLGLLPN
jgi:KDO2-lipid IV(A) lauroyltransferase